MWISAIGISRMRYSLHPDPVKLQNSFAAHALLSKQHDVVTLPSLVLTVSSLSLSRYFQFLFLFFFSLFPSFLGPETIIEWLAIHAINALLSFSDCFPGFFFSFSRSLSSFPFLYVILLQPSSNADRQI
ncbi:hypothetical protein F5Y14DRAFT_10724 [Nemania sp. NC0429]|nr:hypothetical protein F5Y14DRAFT_10724 [Nemania sp. NC0429]